jgi:Methyl-accepting chemotaxis protein
MNILFLCTGNSCRSIIAEALFRSMAPAGVSVQSAGSRPAGHVHPRALEALSDAGIATNGLASKSWDDLAEKPSVVITLCANAAGEACPVYFGKVVRSHWGMEEMNATVLEVAKNAQMAADISMQTKTQALEGARIVNNAVSSIKSVHTQSLAIKADMDALGQQAEGIGQIMGVIADIADQTNLLALNAAIEAARAGDAGRGFAVVADEVRKLAEKTMTATQEVGQAVRGIQEGTKKNIQNVDSAGEAIEKAATLSVSSGESLDKIMELVNLVNDQVQSIATASEEQSAASEEINRAVEQVASISAETAQAMQL